MAGWLGAFWKYVDCVLELWVLWRHGSSGVARGYPCEEGVRQCHFPAAGRPVELDVGLSKDDFYGSDVSPLSPECKLGSSHEGVRRWDSQVPRHRPTKRAGQPHLSHR